MEKRELIINSEGTFIKIDEREYNSAPGLALPASLRKIFAQPIKISDEPIKLNDQGGYVSENVHNEGFDIHPSAIVCAAMLSIDETRELEMPDKLPPQIRENAIICDKVQLYGFQNIDEGVFIGIDSAVDQFGSIGRHTFIGANNYLAALSGFAYKVGAYTIVGNNNRVRAESIVGDRVIMGNNNAIEDFVSIGDDSLVHDNCEFTARTEVPAKSIIKSNSGVRNEPTLVIKKLKPYNERN